MRQPPREIRQAGVEMQRSAAALLPGDHHLPAVRDERLDRRPAGLRPEMRRDAAEEERHRAARLPARGDPRREPLARRDVGEQPFPRRELRRQAGQHRLHEPAQAEAPGESEEPHRRIQDRGAGPPPDRARTASEPAPEATPPAPRPPGRALPPRWPRPRRPPGRRSRSPGTPGTRRGLRPTRRWPEAVPRASPAR